nr:CRISPR-associated endoribonuclease Cas6 [Candidatus Njordarchaeota archaeon]
MNLLNFELISPVTAKLEYTGSLLRAAFLGLAQQLCPELAAYLHDVAKIKPYALTPLSPHLQNLDILLREGNTYRFHVTLLREEDLSSILEGLIRTPDVKVRLYAYDLPVSSIGVDFVPVEKFSDGVFGMPNDFRLIFTSPTYLAEYGTKHHALFPDPVKLFPNMLRLWNAFSTTGACDKVSEYYEWVRKNIYPTGFRLETLPVSLTKGRRTVGFIGFCNYHCDEASSPYAKLTHTLCRFAEYANVGGNRSSGFGVVKFVPKEKKMEELKRNQKGESDS